MSGVHVESIKLSFAGTDAVLLGTDLHYDVRRLIGGRLDDIHIASADITLTQDGSATAAALPLIDPLMLWDLVPAERRFVTPDTIRASAGLVGTPDEIVEQLHDLEDLGLREVTLLPPMEHARVCFREFAEAVFDRY